MKSTLIIISLLAVLGVGGKLGYEFWLKSISSAVSLASTAMATKHKAEVSNLKSKYEKEIKQLKKKSSEKVNKLVRKHKGELAKAKTKERAKAKVQRVVSAIPLVGLGAFAIFEKLEFENWKSEHPNGTFEQYSLEIGNEVNEILQDEYGEYYEQYKELFTNFKK